MPGTLSGIDHALGCLLDHFVILAIASSGVRQNVSAGLCERHHPGLHGQFRSWCESVSVSLAGHALLHDVHALPGVPWRS